MAWSVWQAATAVTLVPLPAVLLLGCEQGGGGQRDTESRRAALNRSDCITLTVTEERC